MKKEKNKCLICTLGIMIPGEEYCKLIQYDKKGKFYKEGYYHIKCFRERFLAHLKANQLTDRTMRLLEKAESRLA